MIRRILHLGFALFLAASVVACGEATVMSADAPTASLNEPTVPLLAGSDPATIGPIITAAALAGLSPREKLHRLRETIIADPRNQSGYYTAALALAEACDAATASKLLEAGIRVNFKEHDALNLALDLVDAAEGDAGAKARLSQQAVMGVEFEPNGYRIISLTKGAPAETAGLRVGDRLTGLDGVAVDGAHPLARQVAVRHPGDMLKLRVERSGKVIDVSMVAGSRLMLVPTPDPRACEAQRLDRDGAAAAREGRISEALLKFKAALAEAPQGTIPKAAYDAALAEEGAGATRDAIAHYCEAAEDYVAVDDEIEALVRLLALVERSGARVPDAVDRRYRLGLVRAEEKRYSEAADAMEGALAEAPWIADAYNKLGFAYDATKQYGRAVRALNIFVHLRPNAPDIGNVKTKIVELEDRFGLVPPPDGVKPTTP